MSKENLINIPGRLHSVALDSEGNKTPVSGADEIFDDKRGKSQETINEEVNTNLESTIENIAAEVERASAVETAIDNRLKTVEELAEINIDGGTIGIGTAEDFDDPTTEQKAKVPTIGALLDGADDEPTAGSEKLVKSGGVQKELALGAVYDVSAKNPTAGPNSDGKFTLEYILSNVNTLIPNSWRHGGMLISFVDSSDNKYVQYMLKTQVWSEIPNNWEKTDLEKELGLLNQKVNLKIDGESVVDKNITWNNGYVNGNTGVITDSQTSQFCQPVLLKAGEKLSYKTGANYSKAVVKVDDSAPIQIGDTLSGDVIIAYNTPDVSVNYVAGEDMYIVITCQIASNEVSFTEYNSNSINDRINSTNKQIIFDVSLHNNGATFASLQALLSDANLSTLIPSNVRTGGMSIRFKLDNNNYVQYSLRTNSFSTTPSDWQGIDVTPINGSHNLIESGAVHNAVLDSGHIELEIGSISYGQDISDNYRCRTKGFIHNGIIIKTQEGYEIVGAFIYQKTNGKIEYERYADVDMLMKFDDGIIILNAINKYYRLIIKKTDGTEFTDIELINVISFYDNIGTDKHILNVLANNDVLCKVHNIEWVDGLWVNDRFVIKSGGNSKLSMPVKLSEGDTIFVETLTAASIIIVVTTDYVIPQEEETITNVIASSNRQTSDTRTIETVYYTADKDCYAMIYTSNTYSNVYITKDKFISSIAKDRKYLSSKDYDVLLHYNISSQNVWQNLTYNSRCGLFFVPQGSTVSLTANEDYKTIFALLKNKETIAQGTPSFVEWMIGRQEIPVGESRTLTIYEDCYLYIYTNDASNHIYFPSELSIFQSQNFKDTVNGLVSNNFEPRVKNLTIGDADELLTKGIYSDGRWSFNQGYYIASCVFNVRKGEVISITANSNNYAIVAFLSDTIGDTYDAVHFANETSARFTFNGTQEFEIKEDCLLYVYNKADSNGAVYFPQKITVKSAELHILPSERVTRSCVNLVQNVHYNSVLDSVGKSIYGDSITTDIISVYLGGDWYNRSRYIHCCCSQNNIYGFNASKVIFLDYKKDVINTLTSVASAVEMPLNCQFVAVEFPLDSTDHFVATNNQSILKTFSPYDQRMLVADKKNHFSEIFNTEGSISRMIDVALTYYPYTALGLGYGNIATAFDDIVEPVESEYPPEEKKYDGEKVQINCSTFAQLCLMGIPYENSRYAKPNGKNIGDLYKFDENAEYNYFYTKSPYKYIFGADHEKMYASKLAKYAYDRGLLYLVNYDFSNVEAGDILFTANFHSYDVNMFHNIVHTNVVIGVETGKDGSKKVNVIDTGSHEMIMQQDGSRIYGARFLLPIKNVTFKNIVSTFTALDVTTNLVANTDYSLGTYTLSDNIKAKNHYTLIVKGDLPDDINIGITVGTDKIEIDRRFLYNRGDGVNRKHFLFNMTSNIDISSIGLYVNAIENKSDVRIKIDSLEISKGYFD